MSRPKRLIYACEQPIPIIILKDMTTEGYSAIREPPAELDDSKVMIKRLAQFHAASFFLVESVSCDAVLRNITQTWDFLKNICSDF